MTVESVFCCPQNRDFYFLYSIHASSGAHPASYPVGTEGSFPCSKVSLSSRIHGAIPPLLCYLNDMVLI